MLEMLKKIHAHIAKNYITFIDPARELCKELRARHAIHGL